MKTESNELPDGQVWIYTPYITIKGKRIYRKNGRMFRFPGKRK